MRLTPWPEVVERSSTGIAVIDAVSGCLRAVNPAFASQHGCSPDQMVGRPFETTLPAAARAAANCQLTAADSPGHLTIESEQLRADGTSFPAVLDVTSLAGPDGRLATRIVQVIDLSDLRRMQAQRDEAEARFRTLTEQAIPDTVFVHDGGGRFLDMNHRACEGVGYTRDELLAMSVFDLDPGANRQIAAAQWRKIRPEHPLTVFGTHRRKDGSSYPVEVHVGVEEHGGERRYVAVVRDITERLADEARLRASEQRFRDIVEASADWVWEVDAQGCYTFVSDSVRESLGYQPQEMLGRSPFEFMPAGEADRVRANFARVVAAGRPFRNLQNVNLRKGGEIRHVLTNGQPFFAPDGQLLGFRGLDRDVTDALRAEQSLRRVEAEQREALEQRVAERTAELDRANRAKSEFLASMSHELRTPLNAIIGLSEVLKSGVAGPIGEEQKHFAEDIWQAGKHLHSLINDILDLSKIEAGKLDLVPQEVDVAKLLDDTILVVREKAQQRRIALSVRHGPGVGRMWVDPRKVRQIAYNLLSNAVKFSGDGGAVVLEARICPRDGVSLDPSVSGRLLPLHAPGDDAFLEISVSDTGQGIAAADLEKLFEPFVQLKGSSAQPLEGTGLGLSLVRRFAELHGGTVGVESSPGHGSRFLVWVPRREPVQG